MATAPQNTRFETETFQVYFCKKNLARMQLPPNFPLARMIIFIFMNVLTRYGHVGCFTLRLASCPDPRIQTSHPSSKLTILD